MRARYSRRLAVLVAAVAAGVAGCGTAAGPTAGAAPTAAPGASVPAGGGPGSSAAPTGVPGRATPMWFVSLQMVSAHAGWALRWTGNPGAADAAVLALARTTDGGRVWIGVTPPAARPLLTPTRTAGTLFALGAERAWFAASRERAGRSSRTTVFATADGGHTWRSSAFDSLGKPSFIYFTDPGHGWLVTDLGAAQGSAAVAVYATADGGLRWSLVARTPRLVGPGPGIGGLPVSCGKTGVGFATAVTGWLTGACNAGAPFVEMTRDGGRTWAPQALPIPAACPDGSQATAPRFFGATGFLAVACFPRPYLLVTHDTGTTWSRAALPAGVGSFPLIQFVDARDGFLVPAGPQGVLRGPLYRTFDGGRTWRAVRLGVRVGELGTSVDFVTTTTGFVWVLGADATSGAPPLCQTGDGGRSWACAVPRVTGTG